MTWFRAFLAGALIVGCGRGAVQTAVRPTTGLPNPLSSSVETRLPPFSVGEYELGVNRSEIHGQPNAKPWPIEGIDFDGSLPNAPIAVSGDSFTLRNMLPVPGGRETNLDLIHEAPLVLGKTTLANVAVTGGNGLYEAGIAIWFRSSADTRACYHPHHWLGVVVPPANPLVPQESRDVIYNGSAGQCGGMYVFDARGPSVGWTPGTDLIVDWSHLLDIIHARGLWPEMIAGELVEVQEHIEIAGFTPSGGGEAGGATISFSDWRDS